MKKTIAFLLCCSFVCCFSFTAFAQTVSEKESGAAAEISATVPDSHKITVSADGAEVFFKGVAETEFSVGRLTEPTVLIRANSGKKVKQVLLNGEDITSQVKGGYYKFVPVYEDKTLSVVTEDETPSVQAKTYTVRGTVTQNGKPVEGVTVELRSSTKTAVTDKNGRFSFSGVDCGKHSLTVVKNNEVVGYLELMLSESSSADFGLESDGIYNVKVNRDEIGIDLALNMTNDGELEIEGVTGVREEKESPRTGDESNVILWIILLIISGAAVGTTTVIGKRKYSRKS